MSHIYINIIYIGYSDGYKGIYLERLKRRRFNTYINVRELLKCQVEMC